MHCRQAGASAKKVYSSRGAPCAACFTAWVSTPLLRLASWADAASLHYAISILRAFDPTSSRLSIVKTPDLRTT